MLISSREAAQILAATGLTRDRARRVLLAGFAGEGLRTRGSLLYEDTRVRALLEWPVVDPRVLRQWQLSPWARLEMRRVVEASGANITAVWPRRSSSNPSSSSREGSSGEGSTLDLAEPGEWFEQFRNRRLVTGPGNAWLLWRSRQSAIPHRPSLHPETLKGGIL